MMIEIQKPELEALIHERMQSGQFADIEDVLMQALKSVHTPGSMNPDKPTYKSRTLREVFEAVSGMADDLDLSRNPSSSRSVQIA
jgi:hypothetical protein